MDADVNTHASVYPPPPIHLLVHVDAAHVRHRQIVAYKKCIAWERSPGQARTEQELQSNRIDGNFFSFAKVLRRMCHMDRSRNSSQTRPGLSRPCCCCYCCPQVSYLSIARTTTGEFSVFCAFLKWANLCDTLRQLIKLNKHEAQPRTDRESAIEREIYLSQTLKWKSRLCRNGTKPAENSISIARRDERRERLSNCCRS